MPKTEISFEIVEHIGVLSTGSKGWTKELNLISWNGREPKYDLREWSPEHDKMGKGVTLSKEELEALKDLLQKCKIDFMNKEVGTKLGLFVFKYA